MSGSSLSVVIGVLLVSACSGDPATHGRDAATGEEAARPTARITPGRHLVVIRMLDDLTFDPPVAHLTAGDTIVWVNAGALPHTSTADPAAAGNPENVLLPRGAATWDSGLLDGGESFTRVRTVVGDYTYLCTLHEAAGMVGRIKVVPGGG